MTIEQIQSILYYLKDYAEDREVNLTGVEEAIDMFNECQTYEECKKWIHENI